MPLPTIAGLLLRLESDSISASDGDVAASWVDQTTNAIVGTNHGAVDRTGRFNGAPGLHFDGSSAYVDLGAREALELYSAFTIFVVMRTASAPASASSFVISKDLDPADKGLGLGISPAGAYFMDFGGNEWLAPSGPSLVDDSLHILRPSYGSTSLRPTVDGVRLFDEASAGPQVDPAEPWNLGRCDRAAAFATTGTRITASNVSGGAWFLPNDTAVGSHFL